MIGGEEHCVFFSLGVIDELQSRFGGRNRSYSERAYLSVKCRHLRVYRQRKRSRSRRVGFSAESAPFSLQKMVRNTSACLNDSMESVSSFQRFLR